MKKRIAVIISAVVLCVAAIACAILLPAYQMSGIMQENKGTFSLTVVFAEENFSKEQRDFQNMLAMLLGFETEELEILHLEGEFDKETLNVDIISNSGMNLTDLQFTSRDCLVNVKKLYELASENLSDKVALAKYLLPDWKEESYISLSKVEELFHVTLMKEQNPVEMATIVSEKMTVFHCMGMQMMADEKNYGDKEFVYRFKPEDKRLEKIREKIDNQIPLENMNLDILIALQKDSVQWDVLTKQLEDAVIAEVDGTFYFQKSE